MACIFLGDKERKYFYPMSLLNCARFKSHSVEPPYSAPYDRDPSVDSKKASSGFESQESQDSSLQGPTSECADFSQFELYTVIGKGCYDAATITLAKHIPTGKNVAIKRTHVEKIKFDISLLQKEIILTKQLSCDKVLQHYSSFVYNKEIWTIMPLMAYGSAKDLLHAYFTTGLPEPAISYLLRDVLVALEYLHHRGIIHRAVRASHILIAASGKVCLSGLRNAYCMMSHGFKAKLAHEYPENGLTSLQWLSPEILEQNLGGYDCKSDIYSLGVTACELANGHAPFADMPLTQMLLEKLSGTKPVLADSTAVAELVPDEISGVQDSGFGTETNQTSEIIEVAKTRKFSNSFHNFTDTCLEKEPKSRPTASALQSHSFLKNLKKRTSDVLPGLLQPLSPLTDISKLPKAEDICVDEITDNMENIEMEESWEF